MLDGRVEIVVTGELWHVVPAFGRAVIVATRVREAMHVTGSHGIGVSELC